MKRNHTKSCRDQDQIAAALYLPSTAEMSLADQEAISQLEVRFDSEVQVGQRVDKLEGTPLLRSTVIQGQLHASGAAQLIQRVGIGVAKIIVSQLKPLRCIVLCGPGNNGADGIALALELIKAGVLVSIVIVDTQKHSSQLNEILRELPNKVAANKFVYKLSDNSGNVSSVVGERGADNFVNRVELATLLKDAEIVVDCLLGTGQRGDPHGQIREIVEVLIATVAPDKVISMDLPTGVNGDTGEVYEPCVRASTTIAIQSIKRGLTQYPAKEVVGNLKVVDIGIRFNAKPEFILIDDAQADEWTAPRKPNVNKGDLGTVLVLAGSVTMPGAAILVSLGALHSGAGLVIKAEPQMDRNPNIPPEVIIKPLSCRNEFGGKALEEIVALLPNISSVVIGPGVGVSKNTERFVLELTKELEQRCINSVIDADALNILAKNIPLIRLNHAVLTPHPKEAARLLKSEVAKIERDRFTAIKQIHNIYGGTVLLKGASTIIWNGQEGVVNTTGTPALATAGSGDILAGLIGSLLGQGIPALKAAALGAYYHGKAGIQLSKKTGGAITASALAPHLAPAVKT